MLVYYLEQKLGLDARKIRHLRSLKFRGHLVPDFIIWDDKMTLASLMGTTHYELPIYVEVKSSMGDFDADRIVRWLRQLSKLYTMLMSMGCCFFSERIRLDMITMHS